VPRGLQGFSRRRPEDSVGNMTVAKDEVTEDIQSKRREQQSRIAIGWLGKSQLGLCKKLCRYVSQILQDVGPTIPQN